MSLPQGWSQKESKSKPGVFYYINDSTGVTQWDLPTVPASGETSKVKMY